MTSRLSFQTTRRAALSELMLLATAKVGLVTLRRDRDGN